MDYIKLLKENNLKATPQRLTIVEELALNGHLNIDQIYKALQDKFPSISLATIYKNIHTMLDISFLNEVKIPNKKSVYELHKEEHSHIVCSKCNMIVDINLDISPLLKEASKISDFKLFESSVIFNGLCHNCK